MDHGIDWLGDNVQHEELNHLVRSNKYGWPYVYADGKFNPTGPAAGRDLDGGEGAQSTEPAGLYKPHSAPMQMAFYTGTQFPAEYRGDAFVAMRGRRSCPRRRNGWDRNDEDPRTGCCPNEPTEGGCRVDCNRSARPWAARARDAGFRCGGRV